MYHLTKVRSTAESTRAPVLARTVVGCLFRVHGRLPASGRPGLQALPDLLGLTGRNPGGVSERPSADTLARSVTSSFDFWRSPERTTYPTNPLLPHTHQS